MWCAGMVAVAVEVAVAVQLATPRRAAWRIRDRGGLLSACPPPLLRARRLCEATTQVLGQAGGSRARHCGCADGGWSTGRVPTWRSKNSRLLLYIYGAPRTAGHRPPTLPATSHDDEWTGRCCLFIAGCYKAGVAVAVAYQSENRHWLSHRATRTPTPSPRAHPHPRFQILHVRLFTPVLAPPPPGARAQTRPCASCQLDAALSA